MVKHSAWSNLPLHVRASIAPAFKRACRNIRANKSFNAELQRRGSPQRYRVRLSKADKIAIQKLAGIAYLPTLASVTAMFKSYRREREALKD